MDVDEASRVLRTTFGLSRFDLLGQGQEGFVFGDRDRAYKVFRDGAVHLTARQREHLLKTLGQDGDPPHHVLPVSEVREADGQLVLVSPRMEGKRYSGGHWWDLVELLRECRARGIALSNIHPDNLLLTERGVVFIDVGASVVALTESYWDQMIRRAFLSFRFTGLSELRELMTRSLSTDPPELDGYLLLRHDAEARVPEPDHLGLKRPGGLSRDVSLLIRTCNMEWATIEFQVEHLVRQLEGPERFREIVVSCDSNLGPFARQYEDGDRLAEERALNRLVEKRLVDRVLWTPDDANELRSVSRRWFAIDSTESHGHEREPTLSSLWALDQCSTELVLQVDSDILIGRLGSTYPLSSLIEVLHGHDDAVAVSLPPPLSVAQPYTESGPNGKWRMEVRCSLVDRKRLERLLPLPNQLSSGRLELPWYRAVDVRLRTSEYACYRGGEPGSFMLHVPNHRKADRNGWFNVVKAVERGACPANQFGRVDLEGGLGEWLGVRTEDLVFVVRGRDIPLDRLDRCILSILGQRNQGFGVIFIDAGSTNGMLEMLETLCQGPFRGRSSLYRNWEVGTIAENQFRAIRNLVGRADAIVAFLDADDALLGGGAVDTILTAHHEGADLTVGSMLRTDRPARYEVSFDNPRANRGGNVWQHLRSFRRCLFDRIDPEDLKVGGEWIPYAEDWAFMLPMVEMAKHPVWIREPIYLYDPIPNRRNCSVDDREAMIAKICQKVAYRREAGVDKWFGPGNIRES